MTEVERIQTLEGKVLRISRERIAGSILVVIWTLVVGYWVLNTGQHNYEALKPKFDELITAVNRSTRESQFVRQNIEENLAVMDRRLGRVSLDVSGIQGDLEALRGVTQDLLIEARDD